MDGVLVDNMSVHIEAFGIFCARYGVEDWQQKLKSAVGMGNNDIMQLILPQAIINSKGLQRLADEKEAIYREIYAPRMKPVAGLRELLQGLRAAGVRCAVGTSGPQENLRMVLDGCHIAKFFDAIVSSEDVSRCKPDPEIYLTAAAKLELSPSACLVFEDAPAGIEAARHAGIGRIVALTTSFGRETLQEMTPDRIISDFTEITDLNNLLR